MTNHPHHRRMQAGQHKARYYAGASALILAAIASPVQAADECGAAVGGIVVCNDTSLNPYATGITYNTTDNLEVTIAPGIVANRPTEFTVDINGTGAEQLTLNLQAGSSIYGNQSQRGAARVKSSGDYDILINAAGFARTEYSSNPSPGLASATILAHIDASAALGNIQLVLHESGRIEAEGEAVDGLYALHESEGNSGIIIHGEIDIVGPNQSRAALSQIANASSTGTAIILQSDTSNITVTSDGGIGLYVKQDGLGAVRADTSGDITLIGEGGFGVVSYSGNADNASFLDALQSNTGSITVTGDDSIGLAAIYVGLGNVTTASDGRVTATGAATVGTLAHIENINSSGNLDHRIEDEAIISVTGDNSIAVKSQHDGLGTSNTQIFGDVTASGANSHAVSLAVTNSANSALHQINLLEGAVISSTGTGADSIVADSQGSGLLQLVTNSVTTANGTEADAMNLVALNGGRIRVETRALSNTVANGANAIGISAQSSADTTILHEGRAAGAGNFGVAIYATSQDSMTALNIGSDAIALGGWQANSSALSPIHGAPAAAIVIGSATGSTLNNAGNISARSDRAIFDLGRINGGGGALVATNDGVITGFVQLADVTGNRFNNRADGIFTSRHFADTNGDNILDTKRVAISDFGDASSIFTNAGLVQLGTVASAATTDAAGYYVPTTGADSRPLESSVYALSRAGITQSIFTNLGRFENSGTIDLRGPEIGNSLVITANPAAGGAAGSGLFVSNGGNLYLNVALGAGIPAGGQSGSMADMLIVDGTTLGSGATQIHLGFDAADGAFTAGNGIQLVEVRNKSASADDVFTLAGPVAGGAFEYNLRHHGVGADNADGNWYLRSTIDDGNGGEVPDYRDNVPLIATPQPLAHRLGFDMLGTYHDRQGEDYGDWLPRNAQQSGTPSNGHSGRKTSMWARVFGSDANVDYRQRNMAEQAQNFAREGAAYDYGTVGFQMGFDLLRSTSDNGGRTMAGIYGGHGDIEAQVNGVYGGRAGRTKVESFTGGLYITHKTSGGAYIDLVGQASRFKSKSYGNGYVSRTDGWGYAGSAEVGLPIAFGTNWLLEPQAQIIYQRLKLDDVSDTLSQIDYRNGDALWGRLGVRLANKSVRASGLSNMLWARFNVWHDFDRHSEYRISNLAGTGTTQLQSGLGGTWGQGQLAFSSELARNVSGFISGDYNFSLDKMKSDGYGGRFGLRFVW